MKILKYPHPFKSWITISNDPDNTTIENWKQLHSFIWGELSLPISDSLFLESHNENIPNQVNLLDYDFILKKHHHETLHFWGDYVHSKSKCFSRDDAINALQKLKEIKFIPTVWIDHSFHQGNFIHGQSFGAMKIFTDSSGVEYNNIQYTLDLAIKAGVKYIWNGQISNVIGQDRKVNYNTFLKSKRINLIKRLTYYIISIFLTKKKIFSNENISNLQVWKHKFPDGNILYCFERYGEWKFADIDGLGNVISPNNIDTLIKNNGSCIVYTHLGKRNPVRQNDKNHIPENTKNALIYLKKLYVSRKINITSITDLLDYIIIRDNIKIDKKRKIIHFKSDGIRFKKLTFNDMKKHKFSFESKNINSWKFYVQNLTLNVNINSTNNIHTVSFYEK